MFSTGATVRSRLFHPRRHREPANLHNRGIDHQEKTAQGSLYGLPNRENHGNRPQHHDRDVDDQRRTATAAPAKLVVHINGHVNDETGTATVENHSFLHVWTTTQEAARPAQQGRRSLCPATRESLGHKDHGDLPLRNDKNTTTMMNCNCLSENHEGTQRECIATSKKHDDVD